MHRLLAKKRLIIDNAINYRTYVRRTFISIVNNFICNKAYSHCKVIQKR